MTKRGASAQQRRASDPSASAWVNANAGSGKTRGLVDRIVRLMLGGAEPAKILCLTFTKAAAAEMASRLFDLLSGWISLDDAGLARELQDATGKAPHASALPAARRLFARALETRGGLKIQTLHAFSERLLHLFPVEAGVAPGFSVLDAQAAAECLKTARDRIVLAAANSPDGELSAALGEIARRVQAEAFDELLGALVSKRGRLEPVLASSQSVETAIVSLRRSLGLAEHEDAASVQHGLSLSRADYERLAAALASGGNADAKRGDLVRETLRSSSGSLADLEEFYVTKKGKPRELKNLATAVVQKKHPWVHEFLAAEQERLRIALDKLANLESLAATRALLLVAREIFAEYNSLKRRQAALDFDDLIMRVKALLESRPDAAWVLYKLDGGIDHVLVDEAQDTSPEQWEIIRALSAEFFAGSGAREAAERTLFVVGDRKQSIFSFQGADPDVFEDVHDEFKSRVETVGQPFHDVDFTVSFRSTQVILSAVDSVFAQAPFARRGLNGGRDRAIVHQTNRLGQQGLVELWPLIEPEAEEKPDPWTAPVDREWSQSPRRRLARKIAETVHSWIGRRAIAATGRAVEPRDILILVRKRTVLFDALVRELRALSVPVAGADRLKLQESLAVLDLLALIRFCLLPQDDYALACTLKSPLVPEPVSEEALFDLAWRRPASLWQRLAEARDRPSLTAHRRLSRWRLDARDARPYEFLSLVLQETRGAILKRLGSEAGDALDAFLDQALAYERDADSSLSGFARWFSAGTFEIKRNMEQAAGEVRIMTVHGAKGLEAPIVILPDTTDTPTRRNRPPVIMVRTGEGMTVPYWRLPRTSSSDEVEAMESSLDEEQAAEYYRLLYVALTRARDELYVCGYRGSRQPPAGCWYNVVSAALRDDMEAAGNGWRLGAPPRAAVGAASLPALGEPPPAWLFQPAPAPERMLDALAPSHLLGGVGAASPQRRRGEVIHHLLRVLPDMPPQAREAAARRVARLAHLNEDIVEEITALFDHPVIGGYLAEGGMSEVPVIASLDGEDRPALGRIDRLIVRDDEAVVVEYKSDRHVPATVAEVDAAYLAQIGAYREAVARIYPGKRVRAVFVWTAAPLVMEVGDVRHCEQGESSAISLAGASRTRSSAG